MADEESGGTIPPDIITDILYRLPAKSIGRFRCVSKSWLSLLSDPKFIKTHRNTLNQNHLIFISNNYSLYSLPSHQNHEENVLLKPTKIQLELPHVEFNLQGSCNGLVLVSADDFDYDHTLVVFNPTTREFVELPVSGYEMVDDLLEIDIMYGFGYDSVADDYKVVTISYFHYNYLISPDVMSVHVYSLRTNTWKSVIDSPYDHSHGKSLSGVFVNGFLHWIAKEKGGSDHHLSVIVAFSIADEKFSQVPLPTYEGDDIMSKNDCKLVALGEKLAIFLEMEGVVWLMDEYGLGESWTKIIINGFNEVPLVEPMIFDENGKFLLASRDLILMYNVKERTFCNSLDISWNQKYVKIRGTYVESLVSPKFT
uniref:F-box/kelch-repeat protein At3g06240-like n=1 Tax=Erigeron canadensis TaxID=72917 RepID=UPI001CB9D44B|nr:F-box/kelch-repeat protein At3g06240-like [Erigeron canadensis]